MIYLDMFPSSIDFPSPDEATDTGLIAIGGDLSPERLVNAYRNGIFPWYELEGPILWWHPPRRLVLFPHEMKVSRSLRKSIRNRGFTNSINTRFDAVIDCCSKSGRRGFYPGTWITREMQNAYCELHRLGYAHSVETWLHGKLVGGLYGVSIGTAFFGESMFAFERDSSKVALYTLVKLLIEWNFSFIDCQIPSNHLASLGARILERDEFMIELNKAVNCEIPTQAWGPGRTVKTGDP